MKEIALILCLSAATSAKAQDIAMIGDSILAWNRESGESVGVRLAEQLGQPIDDHSTGGATLRAGFFGFGDSILTQFDDVEPEPEIVIFNGGGNDLAPSCHSPDAMDDMSQLIGADLTGLIPSFVDGLVSSGKTAIYLAYYDMPDVDTEFTPCVPMFEAMEVRLIELADQTSGFHVAQGRSVIDPADLSNYDSDYVHPSPKASKLLAELLAEEILALQ